MLETPIQLEFYKKVEIYFKILKWHKKQKRINQDDLKNIWDREQQILGWLQGHHKIYREFELSILKSRIYPEKLASERVEYFLEAVNSLVEKELMEEIKTPGRSLYKFQPIAYLYSDVLVEMITGNWLKKFWNNFKYWFFIILIWVVVVSVAITAIHSAYKIFNPANISKEVIIIENN